MMLNNIFDTHSHYDDTAFGKDREKTIINLKDNGICAVINAGVDLNSCRSTIELSKKYDFIYAAIGVHPLNTQNLESNYLENLKHLIKNNKKVVAIGEIGLDYHTDKFIKEKQIKIFSEQIELANSCKLPVIIHSREANEDAFKLIKKYKPNGVIHCFSGSLELAQELIKLGLYIGVGGVITFKNAKKLANVVSNISLENILLETDCPYLAPVPYRGTRCVSSMIIYVAQKIAELKNISPETVLEQTKENAKKLFKI